MKRIEAIIRPEKVHKVKEELTAMGCTGLTVYGVQGHGTQCGVTQSWRGSDYSVDLLPKTSVVCVVHDHEVNDVVDVITQNSRTDHIGDGKIFVTDVEQVIRIRTGETGAEAI